MVELNNGKISVKIREKGAELASINKNGKEYIWQADSTVWGNSAPIMFPICGGLRDDKYIFEGKEYTISKHGFAKLREFSVAEKTENKVRFELKYDAETLKCYPFEFKFSVVYELFGNSVKITYETENLGNKTMYFSNGSHEAYATPEGIEDYDIIFPEKETLDSYLLNGNFIGDFKVPIIKESDVFPLYDKYFFIDALVFKNVKSKSATLRNRKTGKALRVDFPTADYLVLWHKYSSGFMCIEPWNGIADYIYSDYDITKKEGIISLEAGKTDIRNHTVTVIE